MKRVFSAVIILSLLMGLAYSQTFYYDVKADTSDESAMDFVEDIRSGVENFHKTHLVDKDGHKYEISENKPILKKSKSKSLNLPDKYIGPYTSIKAQGTLGACWMFGNISAIETDLLNREGYPSGMVDEDPVDLSEAQGVYVQYNKNTVDGTPKGTPKGDSDNDIERAINDNLYYGYDEGGWQFDAAMSLSSGSGAEYEENNPYLVPGSSAGTKVQCAHAMADKTAASYRANKFNIKSAVGLDNLFYTTNVDGKDTRNYNPSARDVWKQYIIEYGSISASIYMSFTAKYTHAWGLDESEYYYMPNYWVYDANDRGGKGNYSTNNHTISIIGFDDNFSKYNFASPKGDEVYDSLAGEVVYIKNKDDGKPDMEFDSDGHLISIDISKEPAEGYSPYIVPKEDGCFIVKNSYGTIKSNKKVYDDGIMYMSYMEQTVTEPTSMQTVENLDQLISGERVYDTVFSHSSKQGIGSIDTDSTKAANVFKNPKNRKTDIEQIGYWTHSTNYTTSISVYKNLTDSTNPESGELVYTVSGIVDKYEGYHTINLEKAVTVNPNTMVSVVISQTDSTGKSKVSVESDFSNTSKANYIYNSNANESFYYVDSSWMDSKDLDVIARKTGITVGNTTVKLLGNSEVYTTYNVTVDDVTTEVLENDEFTFPTSSTYGYATLDHETLYAPGQKVKVTSDITVKSIGDVVLEMKQGASIRLDGIDGIRFMSEADCNDNEVFNSSNVKVGTLITSYDMLAEVFKGELDLDVYNAWVDGGKKNGDIKKIDNEGWLSSTVGLFAAGIMKVNSLNWERDYIAKSYIKFNYCDDTSKIVYSDFSSIRSIKQVALAIKNAGYPGLNDDEIAIVNKYLEE